MFLHVFHGPENYNLSTAPSIFGVSMSICAHSDRLEASASAQRGSGSVGQAARMDRRALMQDIDTLRDLLAQTKPKEATTLTEGLLCC